MDPGDQLYTLDELRCWKVENLKTVLDDERSIEIGIEGGASSVVFFLFFVFFLYLRSLFYAQCCP